MAPERLLLLVATIPWLAAGCSHGDTSLPEDTSISGATAGAVGAALALANPSGAIPADASLWDLLVPSAYAGLLCPTFKSASGNGCTTVNGSAVTLAYSSCSRGTAGTTSLTGTYEFQVTSGFTVACGAGVGGNGTTYTAGAEFSSDTGTGGATGTFVSASGTKLTIDHSSAGLGNYQNDSLNNISTNLYPGDGNAVTWLSGARTAVAFHSRLTISTSTDYSITTDGNPLIVSESPGAGSRSVSGNAVVVYDNINKVKGATTFTNVTYQDNCCLPVSGVVTTRFSSTSLSGATGQALNGQSETLTFKGCGSASFTSTGGSTSNVAADWCI